MGLLEEMAMVMYTQEDLIMNFVLRYAVGQGTILHVYRPTLALIHVVELISYLRSEFIDYHNMWDYKICLEYEVVAGMDKIIVHGCGIEDLIMNFVHVDAHDRSWYWQVDLLFVSSLFDCEEQVVPHMYSALPMPRFTRWVGLLGNHLPLVKKLLGGDLKLGYFSSVCPWQLALKIASFLSI